MNVIEFRHESWWNEKVYQTLKENRVTFCSISYPLLPEDVIRSIPVMYYRFHGVPELYASRYSVKEIERVAAQIRAFRGVTDVYCYFNNDIHAEAIRNGLELAKMVAT